MKTNDAKLDIFAVQARSTRTGTHQRGGQGMSKYNDDTYIKAAKRLHEDEGTFEFDDEPEVSKGDDGAYVQGWIWVADDDVTITDSEIDGHPFKEWQKEVAEGDTREGYLDWAQKREQGVAL